MSDDREPTGDLPIDSDLENRTPPRARPDTPDPADEVPVPGAMSAAEIDERAQVVEKLRRERGIGDPDSDSQP